MSFDRTYRRTTTTTNRNRRPLYAPPPAPSNHRNHSVLGYWVPLVVTGTIALGGLAAWIWSERSDRDEDDYAPDQKPQRPPQGAGTQYPPPGSQPYAGGPPTAPGPGMPPPVGGHAASYYGQSETYQSQQQETRSTEREDSTFYGQVRGMVRRAPSPEQFFSQASKQVSAGMAAAGAALSSIIEESPASGPSAIRGDRFQRESREGFSDHERWSEEADEQTRRTGLVEAESERRAELARGDKGKRSKKSIAMVLSADLNMDGKLDQEDMDYMTEHASILSHLPDRLDPNRSDLFVLIYTPGLASLPPLDYRPAITSDGRLSGLGSSYSAIDTPTATPGEELKTLSPRIDPVNFTSPGSTFDALYQQALSLVSDPSQILPFTTVTGYVPILRHLAPQLVYVSEMLAGDEGDSIAQLKGWVGHTILVAGDDGTGGLADTETEDEGGPEQRKDKWYETSSMVGLGKAVEIVDAARVGEDWARRVEGRE